MTTITRDGKGVLGEAVADAINAHFVNAGSYNSWNDNEDAETTPPAKFISESFLRPIDSMEIESLIRKLMLNATAGIDGIGRSDINTVALIISEVLAYAGCFREDLGNLMMNKLYWRPGADVRAPARW